MGLLRPSLIFTLFVVAIVALVILTRSSHPGDGESSGGIRRHLRKIHIKKPTAEINPKMDHIPFDPLIAEYENKLDDRAWEQEYLKQHHEAVEVGHHDEHDGLTDESWEAENEEHELFHHGIEEEEVNVVPENVEEEEFNYDHFDIGHRLRDLFPLIDISPSDQLISLEELAEWHISQAERNSIHRTLREMEVGDKDQDGMMSLKEVMEDETPGEALRTDLPEGAQEHVKRAERLFSLADMDGDGLLDLHEYNDYLHPEDSKNPHVQDFVRDEEFKHRDQDGDGKLSWQEFHDHVFEDLSMHAEEEEHEGSVHAALRHHEGSDPHAASAHVGKALEEKKERSRKRFQELDVNKDGFITSDEFKPLMKDLMPSEESFANQQAETMMKQADTNKDGYLTLEEMMEDPYVFYNTVHDEHEMNLSSEHEEL